jgi:hypothetical protein
MKLKNILKSIKEDVQAPRNVSEMLAKYPKLKVALIDGLKVTNPEIITSINLLISTPSKFEILTANKQTFEMEYNKIGYTAIIDGVKYNLDGNADEKQRGQKALNNLLGKGELKKKDDGSGDSTETPTEEPTDTSTPPAETSDTTEEPAINEDMLYEIRRIQNRAGIKCLFPNSLKNANDILSRVGLNESQSGKIHIGTDTRNDTEYYFETKTGTFHVDIIDGAGNRWAKVKNVNTIDDILAKVKSFKWTDEGKKLFPEALNESFKQASITSIKIPSLRRKFNEAGYPVNKIETYNHHTAGPVLSVEFKNSIQDINDFLEAYQDMQQGNIYLPDIEGEYNTGGNKWIFNFSK